MSTDSNQPFLSNELISRRARDLWAAAGCPAERDLEFWLTAEAQLREERRSPARPPQPSPEGIASPRAPARRRR